MFEENPGRRGALLGLVLLVGSLLAPAPAIALFKGTTPANKAMCAHFKHPRDLELCKDACKAWPASKPCLLLRRWGDAGTAVLIHAVKNKVRIDVLGKQEKLPALPTRLLLLYADATGYHRHPWVKTPPLDRGAREAIKRAMKQREQAVAANKRDQPQRVLQLLRQAHGTFLRLLGRRHPHTFETEGQSAYALIKMRRFKEARRTLDTLLKRQQATYGGDHPNVADTLQLLGQVAHAERRFADARDLFMAALEIAEPVWGNEHPKTLVLWNNAAFAYDGLGDQKGREKALRRSLAIGRRVLGPKSLQVATALNNLSVLMSERARFAEAEKLSLEAIAIRKAMGAKAADLAGSYHNLGSLKQNTGEFAAARRYLGQAMRLWKRAFDPKGLQRASTLLVLGQVLSQLGDFQGAMVAYRKCKDLREAGLPRGHPLIARVYGDMGQLLDRIGGRTPEGDERTSALKKAGELLTLAWKMTERAQGKDHPQTLRRLAALAGHHTTRGEPKKAATLLRRVAAGLAKAEGAEHPQVAAIWNNLGVAEVAANRLDAALKAYRKAEAILSKVVGSWHPDTQKVRINVLRLQLRLGKVKQARKGLAALSRESQALLAANVAVASSDLSLLFQVTELDALFNAAMTANVLAGDARGGFAEALRWQGAGTRAEVLWRQLRRAKDEGDDATRGLLDRYEETQLGLLMARGAVGTKTAGKTKQGSRAADAKGLAKALPKVERQLADRIPALAGGAGLLRPSVTGVCKALTRKKASLVDYVRYVRIAGSESEQRYGAFVVAPGRRCKVRWVELGPAKELDALVATWREGVAKATACFVKRRKSRFCKRPFRKLDRAGQQLRAKVWAPVATGLGRSMRTWIVPASALTNVAFDGLPDAKGRYLVEERTLGYLPYPAAAMRERTRGGRRGKRTTRARGAFVAGDLDYQQRMSVASAAVRSWQVCTKAGCATPKGGASAGLQLASSPSGVRGAATCGYDAAWSPLPPTEAPTVAATLSAHMKEPVWLARGDQVTEAATRRALPGRRVVHFATHGFFADPIKCGKPDPKKVNALLAKPVGEAGREPVVDPMAMSAVVLSGGNRAKDASDPANDGVLSAREVARLDLRGTEVVALSACETGLGFGAEGEGNLGLSRAFLVAGAGQTVASLWQVPSKETAALFEHFYAAVVDPKQGGDAVVALRDARLKLLAQLRAQRLKQSTFLWAAFVPVSSGL